MGRRKEPCYGPERASLRSPGEKMHGGREWFMSQTSFTRKKKKKHIELSKSR